MPNPPAAWPFSPVGCLAAGNPVFSSSLSPVLCPGGWEGFESLRKSRKGSKQLEGESRLRAGWR